MSPTPAATSAPTVDVIELLKQLGGLRDAGVITDEDFEAKKTELLSRL
ncbi:SHOCT domain-containing protein [Frigoribacterium sp. SL97]|nr:SHOCT domain-containing protein [Frigoribacterium sp. SL97]WAC52024.1 SHOCT domain-containing protein [Frigoribacterium sp. SL97]